MNNLKVCHISTYQDGGAGTAAMRLHNALLNEGIVSNLVCSYLQKPQKNVHQVSIKGQGIGAKILHKSGFNFSIVQKLQKRIKKADGSYEYYSIPFSNFPIEEHHAIQEADIIHLHWVSNFINYPSFFSKIKKPIVWTLHDMNPFMGGFHYKGDLERNENNLALLKIEKQFCKIKKKSLASCGPVHIVTPSKWLLNQSCKSEITGHYPHYHIPNGLNTDLFKPFSQRSGREIFNLPVDKQMILFVCESLKTYRKGFDLLINALKNIHKNNFFVAVVGEIDNTFLQLPNLYTLGRINDERLLSLLYATADIFVLPSREDNLPNVMIEALCCGTPVIGFKIGGVADTIINGFNGLLCSDISSNSLQLAIEEFLIKPVFDRTAIRYDSIKKYSSTIQSKHYIELYKKISLENI